MPFTFCHPAIILPLTGISRQKLSASALIMGSMAPDFEYFLKMRMSGVHGHTLSGIFYFDLPLTLALLFVFHLTVRDPLIRNLPTPFQKRFQPLLGFNWLNYVKHKWYVILYSALIGIASHIFWDSFTHQGRFFAELIPWLHGYIDVFNVRLLRTEFAQLASTVIGAVVIFYAIIAPSVREWNWTIIKKQLLYWTCAVFIALIVLLIRQPSDTGEFTASAIAAGLIGIIGSSVLSKKLDLFVKE